MQWWYKNKLSLHKPQPGCELFPWPSSHWWCRDKVPSCKCSVPQDTVGDGRFPAKVRSWRRHWDDLKHIPAHTHTHTHTRWWRSTRAAEILPRVLQSSEQNQGFKGDFTASSACCLRVFVPYPRTIGSAGGSACLNGGLWGSAALPLAAGKLPQTHGSEKISEVSSVQEKDECRHNWIKVNSPSLQQLVQIIIWLNQSRANASYPINPDEPYSFLGDFIIGRLYLLFIWGFVWGSFLARSAVCRACFLTCLASMLHALRHGHVPQSFCSGNACPGSEAMV